MATNLLFKSCVQLSLPLDGLASPALTQTARARRFPLSPRSSSSLLYKTIPVVAQQAVIPTGASALTKCVAAVSSTTPLKLAVAKPLLPAPANFLGRAVVM